MKTKNFLIAILLDFLGKRKTGLRYTSLLLLTLFLFASCKKDEVGPVPAGGNTQTVNPGNVNQEAVGKWLHGTFAMANYWEYDGTYSGNPFSQSVAFNFLEDGTYEMFYAGETNDFGCITDAFSYYKGYVNFTDSSFTLHPQQGRFRGYYTCNAGSNFDRPALVSELNEQTFYYTFETDSNNKKWIVVRFNPGDQYPSYFGETNW